MGPADLVKILRFAADPDAQTADGRLTLTLGDVEQIMGEGRLDLSGGRSEDARRIKRPAKKASGDDLGWWDLGQGSYWVRYNEIVEIPPGHLLVLQPHVRLMRNGVWHPCVLLEDWEEQMDGVMLTVSTRGVRLSENAPVSTGILITRSG
jgi:deoxycytidine triphosphate deaminase